MDEPKKLGWQLHGSFLFSASSWWPLESSLPRASPRIRHGADLILAMGIIVLILLLAVYVPLFNAGNAVN